MNDKLKTFYHKHKIGVWIVGFGLFGLVVLYWTGSALSELYAVDAISE